MAKKNEVRSLTLTKRVAKQLGITSERLALIMDQVPEGPNDQEIALFLYQCERTGLDPLSRQIYLVGRYDKREKRNVGAVQTGIDGYRLVAERTGEYAGSDDALFNGSLSQYDHKISGEELPITATVTVKKVLSNGGIGEWTATAEWDAYYPGDRQGFMWKKMPYVMLSKCAEALALRKAFPAELSGVYTAEEMAQAGGRDDEEVKSEMMAALGVKNEKALKVMERLSEVGIDSDDVDLQEIIGCKLGDIEDTEDGERMLFSIWEFAGAIKNGVSRAEATDRLKDQHVIQELEEDSGE